MKILVLSWRGPGHPYAGGAEQSTWKHMQGWVRNGADVTLFTSSYSGSRPFESIDGIKIYRKGDQYFGVKLFAFIHYKKNLYDLVIDEFHGIPFYSPLFTKKTICLIHEVAGPVWKLNPWPRPINLIPLLIGPIIEKYTLKYIYKYTNFITVSNSTKKDLIKAGVRNIKVIQNGVTLPKKVSIYPKSSTPTFVYLSALSKDKGAEDVIEAFRIISTRINNAELLIMGKGEEQYVNYLKSKSDNLKINFLGYVDELTKFKNLSISHVMLFPSFHEGWGLVVIEANSVGTPVVVYPAKGLVDSVNNGVSGIICDEMTPRSLAEKAIELIQSKNYQSFSQKSIEWSKNFNWHIAQEGSFKLLREIYKKREN